MNTKFGPKIDSIRMHYKVWMEDETGAGILGDGKWKMLKLIEQKGSLKAACNEMGYTYRRTWGNLKKIEEFFGFPLLEKHRGGIDGGNTQLTPEGKRLVAAFDRFHAEVDQTIRKGFSAFIDALRS